MVKDRHEKKKRKKGYSPRDASQSPTLLLYQTLTYHANISPALNDPRASYQTPRDDSIVHSLQKLFKLSNPKVTQHTYLASPVLSHKNPNKDSGPCSPLLSFCLLTHPSASPDGPVQCALPLSSRVL